MKKPLLYLFIFSVLLNIFTYMYFTKKSKFEEDRIENFQKESKAKKDSIASLNSKLQEADYFSLPYNDNAIEYYENFDVNQLSSEVRDEIMSLNTAPNGNSLTKYDPINGNKPIINKIKILNHRWIIADFAIGNAWGEVLIKYFKNEGKPTEFETIETFIYPDTLK